jgi:hypothetical protein
MFSSFVAAALISIPAIGVQPADSGVHVTPPVVPAQTASPVVNSETGPRIAPIAFSRASPPDAGRAADTTSRRLRRPRAIEYSDSYYTRLTVHRIASYAELPLFGAEYVLGERLLRDERTGFPPSSLKAAHAGVAGALGILFAVNTVTGAWNFWDSRKDPSNRTLRIIHSVAMLGADAGFAWAGAIGGSSRNSTQAARHHRTVSVGSMALATAGTAIMWLFDK